MPTDNNQPPYSDLFDDYVEDYFESGYATFGPEGWEEEPSIPSVRESADVLGMQGAAREYNDTRNLIEVEFEGSRKGSIGMNKTSRLQCKTGWLLKLNAV